MRALALAPFPGNLQTVVSVLLSISVAAIILGASAAMMVTVTGFEDAAASSPDSFAIFMTHRT